MPRFSPAYRLAALALVFSFALGTVLPAFCHQSSGEAMPSHSDAAGHPTVPCEGACHASEQPATIPLTVTPVSEHFSTEFTTVLPALVRARVASAETPSAEEYGSPLVARAGPPPRPVRLHVYNAVFLN